MLPADGSAGLAGAGPVQFEEKWLANQPKQAHELGYGIRIPGPRSVVEFAVNPPVLDMLIKQGFVLASRI
jgi:hypothetical protein